MFENGFLFGANSYVGSANVLNAIVRFDNNNGWILPTIHIQIQIESFLPNTSVASRFEFLSRSRHLFSSVLFSWGRCRRLVAQQSEVM